MKNKWLMIVCLKSLYVRRLDVCTVTLQKSWGRVVDIATAYGLDDREIKVRVPIESEFSLFHTVQTVSVAHPASYPMVTGCFFPRVKRQGCEADHSPQASAEVKKMWIHAATPPYAFMA
jgi:hypothetical protein